MHIYIYIYQGSYTEFDPHKILVCGMEMSILSIKNGLSAKSGAFWYSYHQNRTNVSPCREIWDYGRYAYIYIYIYIHINFYIYIYIYMCMYVYIYIYKCILFPKIDPAQQIEIRKTIFTFLKKANFKGKWLR